MNREEERLVLVERFDDLRQADLVVVKCDHPTCGRRHVALLLDWIEADEWSVTYLPDGSKAAPRAGWNIGQPPPHGGAIFVITPRTVARRIVFKVDTGLTREQKTAEKAPAKRPVGVRP